MQWVTQRTIYRRNRFHGLHVREERCADIRQTTATLGHVLTCYRALDPLFRLKVFDRDLFGGTDSCPIARHTSITGSSDAVGSANRLRRRSIVADCFNKPGRFRVIVHPRFCFVPFRLLSTDPSVKRQSPVQQGFILRASGADGSRTHDLIIANDALYQLSYRPERRPAAAGGLGRGRDCTPGRWGCPGTRWIGRRWGGASQAPWVRAGLRRGLESPRCEPEAANPQAGWA